MEHLPNTLIKLAADAGIRIKTTDSLDKLKKLYAEQALKSSYADQFAIRLAAVLGLSRATRTQLQEIASSD